MEDQGARLEARLTQLERAVRDLDSRLAYAERRALGGGGGLPPETAAVPWDISQQRVFASPDITGPVGLAGRTVMIFAGRTSSAPWSIPDSSRAGSALPPVWRMPSRGWRGPTARRRGTPLPDCCTAAPRVAIAYPLIWEATTRFQLLSGATSVAAVAVVTGAAFGVAWRRRLHLLAWAATVASLGTAAVLLVQTGAVAPYAAYLVALGVAALWLGYDRDWFGLRWPTAIAADLAVLGLTSRALSGQGLDRPATALLVQFLLLGSYLATIAARTLLRGRNVIPFEIAQTPAALVVGLGGAVAVARQTGSGAVALGIAALVIGGGCYAVAFAFVDRRQGRGRNFYFYTSLAFVLTLTGAAVLLPATSLVLTCSALALVSAWCASRFSRAALTLHSAVYLFAGALVSGLLAAAELGLAGSADVPWPPLSGSVWAVVAAAVACIVIPRASAGAEATALWQVPRASVALLLVSALGAIVMTLLAPRIAGLPGAGCDAGTLATLRTGVVALAAVALARLGRHDRFVELRWLLYPLLIGGGLKLLVEDLPHSRPATLFIALALYGGALILAPRLARSPAPRQSNAAVDTTVHV